jgi:hypothetical protein
MKITQILPRNNMFINVFFFFWALFALTNSGWDSSEGSYGAYILAENIIKHGDLGFNTSPSYLFMMAPNSKHYLVHEFGNALFMLPTAVVNAMLEFTFSGFLKPEKIQLIQRFILSFQASTYFAITAASVFSILRVGFLVPIITSFLGTLLMVVTSYFWTYSHNLFDGVLCTMFLALSFLSILNFRNKSRWIDLVMSFVFLGFSLITRQSMIVPIIASFLYLIVICRSSLKIEALSIAFVTLLPFVGWQCWYNHLRTGVFYKSPVQICCPENNALDGNLFIGIGGLLLSPGKSLFIYAPLLILSIYLFKRFYKTHSKEAIYIATLTILWFLLHAKLRSWYGAGGWGPRHFVTILPILFLPFAVNLNLILERKILKFFTIFLSIFGFVLSTSSIITSGQFRFMYAQSRGLDADKIFVWSLWDSQAIDLLKGAFGNLIRMLYHRPIIDFPSGASEIYFYANSTINIWPNALIHAGIPFYVVIILVIPLFILIFIPLRNILNYTDLDS